MSLPFGITATPWFHARTSGSGGWALITTSWSSLP